MKKSLKIYLWTVAATVFFTLGLIMAAKTIGLLIVVLMMIVLPVWGLVLGIVAVEGAINKRRRQKDS